MLYRVSISRVSCSLIKIRTQLACKSRTYVSTVKTPRGTCAFVLRVYKPFGRTPLGCWLNGSLLDKGRFHCINYIGALYMCCNRPFATVELNEGRYSTGCRSLKSVVP